MSAVYDQKKIDALASELMEPQRLADGGPPDVPPRSRMAKAAAAVRQAVTDPDDYEITFHRTNEPSAFTVEPRYSERGAGFDGVFAGPKAGMHGDYTHAFVVPKAKILRHFDLKYDVPYENYQKAVKALHPRWNDEQIERAYDYVTEDKNIFDQDPEDYADLFGGEADTASYMAQGLRGAVARNLGYDAVEMRDETGTSLQVLSGARSIPLGQDINLDDATREIYETLKSPQNLAKGGLVDKLRSAASSVKEAGNVYKAAVGNMFSPFEPREERLPGLYPSDWEYPEQRLRRPGIVNLALSMPNMPADMRYLFGAVKDAAIGDEVPDEEWRRFDTATEAQGRYEEDMDTWLRAYTGKSVDELSAPMSAVLGVSEALVQPSIISARAVEKLPRLARYLSNITEFATPVTVASPGAMTTGAVFNAGIRTLPALTDDDELKQIYNSYLDQDLPNKTGRDLTGREQAGLNKYLQELLGKKDGGLIDRINQSFYENISKPAVGTAIDMTLGLGDLAQMAARYLGNKAGFDAGEFTSVAQPVKEAIGVDDYNPYTFGGVGASILPFAAAGRTAQAINAAPAGVRQIQAALPNLGRESAAYVGAEAAGAGAREFMPDSPMAEVLASVAGGMGGSALGSQPTSMGIIKEKGGNWLDQSIKNRVQDLHTENQYGGVGAPADRLAAMEARYTPEVMASFDPDLREQAQGVIDTLRSHAQIDNWIDSKLTKYIRNEMATESDPIRLQADAFEGIRAERLAQKDEQIARAIDNMERARLERGRTPEEMTRSQAQIRELQRERALIAAQTGLHVDPETIGFERYKAPQARERLGYPEYGSGRSYAGKAWEDSSDVAINRTTPEAMLSGDVKVISGNYVTRNNFLQKYPWMQSIPSDASIYGLDVRRGGMDALGFDHMMDELRNATNPDSDLPENLRIDPNNLSKMSVPQIVQKVDEINAYRATLAREANERLANNAATRLYREYSAVPGSETPNQQELRWVELALPDAVLPEGYTTVNSPDGLVRLIDRDGRELSVGATPEEAISLYNRDERTKSLADALKYEGDTLNHCVGGYCDKVVSGRSRIYSLRDALGQPYATIETGKKPILYSDIVQAVGIDAADEMLEKGMSLKQMAESIPEVQNLENILQIKGKRNAAPTEEYLPFVQDFVRSRDWNEVKDLENAGLYKADPYELGMYLPQDERLRNIAGRRTDDLIKAQQAGLFGNQKYLTRREWEDILRRQIESESGPLPDVEGFAKGGLVYDADAINALANELMEPVELAEGGPPRSKIRRAAAAVQAIDSASTANIPARPSAQSAASPESFRLYHGTPHVFGPSQRVVNTQTGKEYVSDPDMVRTILSKDPDTYEVIGENPLGMFDINRIGTGEGAQAYGFGAYGTQLPDVGRGYRQGLLRRHNIPDIPTIAGKPIEDVYSQIERRAGSLPVEQARPEYDKLSIIEQMMIDGDILGIRQGRDDYDPDAMKWFEQEIAPKYERPGALYEMQVNAPQRMFLDWDMPIIDQTPEVQASLKAAGIYDPSIEQRIALLQNEKEIIALDRDPVTKAIRDERRWHDISKQIEEMRKRQPANMTGRQAYYLSAPDARSQAEASEALKRAGIPGIQYLDQGSRAGGEGTRNFVVFDPKMIEILEKYGVAGAATGAGAMALSGEEEPQEFNGGGRIRRAAAAVREAQGRTPSTLPSNQYIVRPGDIGYDKRVDDRKREQDRIANSIFQYERTADINPPEYSIFDLEGRPFILGMADRTEAASNLLGIEGVDFDIPVRLQGGQNYMFNNPGQVWAADKGAVSAVMNVAKGMDENPLFLPFSMAPTSGDHATMTTDAMLSYARNNMNKREIAKANKLLRSWMPEFKGIDNPDSMRQLGAASGATRKAFQGIMDTEFRNAGGIGIGQARLSVTDPRQYSIPDIMLMNVGEIDRNAPRFKVSGHDTYAQGIPGGGLGRLKEQNVSALHLLPDFVAQRGVNIENPHSEDTYTLRRGVRSGVITDHVLRNIERMLIDRDRGYADGGEVEAYAGDQRENEYAKMIADNIWDTSKILGITTQEAMNAVLGTQQQTIGGLGRYSQHIKSK